jgi:hypothetical protein
VPTPDSSAAATNPAAVEQIPDLAATIRPLVTHTLPLAAYADALAVAASPEALKVHVNPSLLRRTVRLSTTPSHSPHRSLIHTPGRCLALGPARAGPAAACTSSGSAGLVRFGPGGSAR